MKQYWVIINHRTWLALGSSVLVPYLCFQYGLEFDMDLTLISIAIIFPLVFTIRGSFRRREKALEHLSEFRSTLKTLHYFVISNKELLPEQSAAFTDALNQISDQLMVHLKNNEHDTQALDASLHRLHQMVDEEGIPISGRSKERWYRTMKDLHESVENVNAINTHRTPISLKAYCLLFIYIFPLIYAPTIIHRVGPEKGQWITYFILVLSQFILISLYNIQNQLEYPFDDKGMDDIHLESFKLDRQHSNPKA